MEVTLTKTDLISLVKGTVPNYNVMESMKHLGKYIGNHDKWEWIHRNLEKLSNESLWNTYIICKRSWNKE